MDKNSWKKKLTFCEEEQRLTKRDKKSRAEHDMLHGENPYKTPVKKLNSSRLEAVVL